MITVRMASKMTNTTLSFKMNTDTTSMSARIKVAAIRDIKIRCIRNMILQTNRAASVQAV